jgi:hypothetical protein
MLIYTYANAYNSFSLFFEYHQKFMTTEKSNLFA